MGFMDQSYYLISKCRSQVFLVACTSLRVVARGCTEPDPLKLGKLLPSFLKKRQHITTNLDIEVVFFKKKKQREYVSSPSIDRFSNMKCSQEKSNVVLARTLANIIVTASDGIIGFFLEHSILGGQWIDTPLSSYIVFLTSENALPRLHRLDGSWIGLGKRMMAL